MVFNSIEFLIFFIVFFLLYFFLFEKNLRSQNILILLFSYIFYGWWDYRFLSLIIFSTIVDYFVGKKIFMSKNNIPKKIFLLTSIFFNIGLLAYFKYFNFFIDSFSDFMQLFNFKTNIKSLNIILPVGISFYTFQTLSYTIDIYRGKIKPTGNFVAFAAFVSFFPQLVAGPIERASNLLPQFLAERNFDYKRSILGVKQVIWGLFKKIVITPLYDMKKFHKDDYKLLKALFNKNIYDFSGFNEYTKNELNYPDVMHFLPYVSKSIIDKIYAK